MIAQSLLDCLRVLAAFCFAFLLVPALGSEGRGSDPDDVSSAGGGPAVRVLQRFIHASLAIEAGCLLLGHFRLCLPGMLLSAGVLFLVRGALRAGLSDQGQDGFWPFVFGALEDGRAAAAQIRARANKLYTFFIQRRAGAIAAIVSILLAASLQPALRHFHFANPDRYVAAVNLAALTQGQPWKADGALALLAPLVPLTGLDAASILRFSGPLFTVVFVLIVALCAHRTWGSFTAVLVISAASIISLSVAPAISQEWNPAMEAAIYWAAAAVLWPECRLDACLAALLAVMIDPVEWRWAVVLAATLFAASVTARASRGWLKHAARLVNGVTCIAAIALFTCGRAGSARLVQYESAARVCESIVRHFPRNQWIVVSPFQELAFTYGHAWHVELSEFVSGFTVDQMTDPRFRLPYQCPDVFFFVERRPVTAIAAVGIPKPVWRYSPAESADWSSFLYTDPLGRDSLEYRAGQMLAAYGRNHKDLSLFYADDDILVFHLVRS